MKINYEYYLKQEDTPLNTIITYFILGYISSARLYGGDRGQLRDINKKIYENIKSSLLLKCGEKEIYTKEEIFSAFNKEVEKLALYGYREVNDAVLDNDYNSVYILYEIDYINDDYINDEHIDMGGEYTETVSRCDVFRLLDLDKNINNTPYLTLFNKNKNYEYLFSTIEYLVEKILYSKGNKIKIIPLNAISGGGVNTNIEILKSDGNVIETIASDGNSVYSLYEALSFKIKTLNLDKEEDLLIPLLSFKTSSNDLFLKISKHDIYNYNEWNKLLEASYTEDDIACNVEVFFIELFKR